MMPDIHITITGARRVDGYLAVGWHGAMISIAGVSDNKRGELRAAETLCLNLDDSWPERRGKPERCAQPSDIEHLVAFARSLEPGTMLLCHCGRGRSRSTAAALIAMRARFVPEAVACRQLFAQAPSSTPNGWMLTLADRLLGSRLLEECKKFRVKGPF